MNKKSRILFSVTVGLSILSIGVLVFAQRINNDSVIATKGNEMDFDFHGEEVINYSNFARQPEMQTTITGGTHPFDYLYQYDMATKDTYYATGLGTGNGYIEFFSLNYDSFDCAYTQTENKMGTFKNNSTLTLELSLGAIDSFSITFNDINGDLDSYESVYVNAYYYPGYGEVVSFVDNVGLQSGAGFEFQDEGGYFPNVIELFFGDGDTTVTSITIGYACNNQQY